MTYCYMYTNYKHKVNEKCPWIGNAKKLGWTAEKKILSSYGLVELFHNLLRAKCVVYSNILFLMSWNKTRTPWHLRFSIISKSYCDCYRNPTNCQNFNRCIGFFSQAYPFKSCNFRDIPYRNHIEKEFHKEVSSK